MELKDLILSTLEELDAKIEADSFEAPKPVEKVTTTEADAELQFLKESKERLEVLFEGLKSEETTKVEAKLNLVVNFLQFYLSKIDERIDKCSK